MEPQCDACGAEVLDIDMKCPECGHRLTSTGAHRMLGSVVLGQYEIVDILGQGGMSVVYKGRHKLTEQEVALKILPPELAAHSQVKSRFLEEAKALAQLDHPNIVHLYNFGQENGCFVLAMQYVRGVTFERMILEADQLHWGLAASLTVDVLKALEYAHSRGIIHRDMKPSNVLVRENDGSATVMDFGIAKMTTSTKLTATGQTMGTVRYMSPEQVRGQPVGVETDIYSLGASLYEALVGDTPFDGETHFEIMTKHLSEEPLPPSAHGVQVPGQIERAVLRSLAKKPEDRFSSARDFRDALESALKSAESAGELGKAETMRMTRDLVAKLPASSGESGGDAASTSAPSAVGVPPVESDPRGPIDKTDIVFGARRRPVAWMVLAGLVAAASVVVGIVVVSNGGSKSKPAAATVTVTDAGAVVLPEPYRVPGLTYAMDKLYPGDALRVMSVEAGDAEPLRQKVRLGVREFSKFLRGRGYKKPLESLPMTLQLVPAEVMCHPGPYGDRGVPGDCSTREAWYRIREKTLLLAIPSGDPAVVIGSNVAATICLVQRIELCDGQLLSDFVEKLKLSTSKGPAEPANQGGAGANANTNAAQRSDVHRKKPTHDKSAGRGHSKKKRRRK